MAVLISYTHNVNLRNEHGISPLSIVTASVDRINCKPQQLSAEHDIYIRGHVSFAGTSSMEVTMVVDQFSEPLLEAKFLMVARDPYNVKKAIVSPLTLVGEEEHNLFNEGVSNKALR